MAQALENVNVSQNLWKMFSFAQKWTQFYKTVFGEIRFSQKSLINRKKQPHTISRQVLVQQTPIISFCYYKPQRSGPREVRNCREAAVTDKETKILEKGARGDRGSPKQSESPTPHLSNAFKVVSLVRVVVEISIFKKKFVFFENLQKHPGHLGSTSRKQKSFDTAKNRFCRYLLL